MATEFQDPLLDALMPPKVKEAPATVDGPAPVTGARAAARVSAVGTAAAAAAPNDAAPHWRGTCAICLSVLPVEQERQVIYDCCCKRICMAYTVKCFKHDTRCPFCRTVARASDAEELRRLRKHVSKGNTDAQHTVGNAYRDGDLGLAQSFTRTVELYKLGAKQGHAPARFDRALPGYKPTVIGVWRCR